MSAGMSRLPLLSGFQILSLGFLIYEPTTVSVEPR
jgi:hypothetical protein